MAADRQGGLQAADPVSIRIEAGRVVSCTPLARLAVDSRAPEDAIGDPDALLLPALSDAHLHLVACAADRAALDLAAPRVATLAALLHRLAEAARAAPSSAWVRAAGYDEAWLAERRPPTLGELDAAVPARPLRVRHATRHASLLNSHGFVRVERALGPLDEAHAPRDRAGARLGIVYGLEPEITRVVGPLDDATLAAGLRDVGAALARHGVACVDEMTASNDAARVALLAQAVARGALPQRLRAYVADADEVGPARRAAAGRIEVAGVKLLARSADEARSPEMRAAIARARRRGMPIAVHAVEPDVVAEVLDALAAAPPRAAGEPPLADRIEHASLCPPELVARLAAARVAVVTQPAFLAARGDKYRREVEPPLWPWLYPLASLRAAGVPVAAGSDAPVVPLDPRLGLDAAVTRRTAAGDVLASEERLDAAAALDLFTAAAARLRADMSPAGTTPGASADLVVAETSSLQGGFAALRVRATLRAGAVIG